MAVATKREAERKLGELVAPILASHGFERERRLEFLRRRGEDVVERIGWSVFVDRSGSPRASVGAGVRFESVEACRPTPTASGSPTVSVPIHFLTSERRYFDWPLADETDWQTLTKDLESHLRDRVMPFLDQFCTRGCQRPRERRPEGLVHAGCDRPPRDTGPPGLREGRSCGRTRSPAAVAGCDGRRTGQAQSPAPAAVAPPGVKDSAGRSRADLEDQESDCQRELHRPHSVPRESNEV